jgi:hypothetical protein
MATRYQVQPEDTLGAIAHRFGVSRGAIVRANPHKGAMMTLHGPSFAEELWEYEDLAIPRVSATVGSLSGAIPTFKDIELESKLTKDIWPAAYAKVQSEVMGMPIMAPQPETVRIARHFYQEGPNASTDWVQNPDVLKDPMANAIRFWMAHGKHLGDDKDVPFGDVPWNKIPWETLSKNPAFGFPSVWEAVRDALLAVNAKDSPNASVGTNWATIDWTKDKLPPTSDFTWNSVAWGLPWDSIPWSMVPWESWETIGGDTKEMDPAKVAETLTAGIKKLFGAPTPVDCIPPAKKAADGSCFTPGDTCAQDRVFDDTGACVPKADPTQTPDQWSKAKTPEDCTKIPHGWWDGVTCGPTPIAPHCADGYVIGATGWCVKDPNGGNGGNGSGGNSGGGGANNVPTQTAASDGGSKVGSYIAGGLMAAVAIGFVVATLSIKKDAPKS